MNTKRCLLLMLLVVLAAAPVAGYAGSEKTRRVAVFTLGKRFDPEEIATVVGPALASLGLEGLSEKGQVRTIPISEVWWYGSLGYTRGIPSLYYQGSGGLFVLIFPNRLMNCMRIAITDQTRPPDERVVPTVKAIVSALSKQYGPGLKAYSDVECLHAL
jgi:hypothetical protein